LGTTIIKDIYNCDNNLLFYLLGEYMLIWRSNWPWSFKADKKVGIKLLFFKRIDRFHGFCKKWKLKLQ